MIFDLPKSDSRIVDVNWLISANKAVIKTRTEYKAADAWLKRRCPRRLSGEGLVALKTDIAGKLKAVEPADSKNSAAIMAILIVACEEIANRMAAVQIVTTRVVQPENATLLQKRLMDSLREAREASTQINKSIPKAASSSAVPRMSAIMPSQLVLCQICRFLWNWPG